MIMRFATAAAVLVGLTVSATAQMLGPGMPMPGGGVSSAPGAPWPQQQPQQQPPCFSEFGPLRSEAEKRAGVLQAAIKRKRDREELCGLIKNFSAAEAKVVNFVTKNQQQCGVPAEAVKTMKTNHARTLTMQNQVCSGGPVAGKPTGPGLSEALGVSKAPLSTDLSAPHSGTMDTLTGNVLAR
jgi:hypothetical protein